MLLRESSALQGESPDLLAVTDGARAAGSGVPGGEALIGFVEAAVRGDAGDAKRAREAVATELGDAAVVDAAAVIGNFSRMVRIADGTGIPLDTPVAMLSADVREELGIDAFGSAGNTPALAGWQRWLGRALRPAMSLVMRRFSAR